MRNLRNRRANPSPSVMTLFGTKERVLSSASRFCSTTPKTVLFKETPLTDVYIIHGSPAKQNECDIGIGEQESEKAGRKGGERVEKGQREGGDDWAIVCLGTVARHAVSLILFDGDPGT